MLDRSLRWIPLWNRRHRDGREETTDSQRSKGRVWRRTTFPRNRTDHTRPGASRGWARYRTWVSETWDNCADHGSQAVCPPLGTCPRRGPVSGKYQDSHKSGPDSRIPCPRSGRDSLAESTSPRSHCIISSAPTKRRRIRSSLIQVWPPVLCTVRSTTSTCGVAAGPGISPYTYLKNPTFNQPRPTTASSNGPYLAKCSIPASIFKSRAMPTVAKPVPASPRVRAYQWSLMRRTASGRPSMLDQPHDAAPKYTRTTSSPPSVGAAGRKELSSLDRSSHVILIIGVGSMRPRPNTNPSTKPVATAPILTPFDLVILELPRNDGHLSIGSNQGGESWREEDEGGIRPSTRSGSSSL